MNFEHLAQSNIIDTLKLTHAPKEVKQAAIDDAANIILRIVAQRIEDEIPDEYQEEFEHIFGTEGTPQERAAFLNKHVPDFENIIRAETLHYKALAEIIASSTEEKQ